MAKNIWVAASDGDLDRVKHLIEHENQTPNDHDEFSYTPMHAAASYGHQHVLEYLLQHGGNVNITDDDGDTPLYTVETLETAQFLVQHGAEINRVNSEGISPAAHLAEDFPAIAEYLLTLVPSTGVESAPQSVPSQDPSEYLQNVATEQLTSQLLANIASESNASTQEDMEETINRAVRRTVLEGVLAGYQLGQNQDNENNRAPEEEEAGVKRTRLEE